MWNGIIRFHFFFHGHPLYAPSLNPLMTIHRLRVKTKLTKSVRSTGNKLPLIFINLSTALHCRLKYSSWPQWLAGMVAVSAVENCPLLRFIVCSFGGFFSDRVKLNLCALCDCVCIYAKATVTNKAIHKCVCASSCAYLCLCVSTGCPQSDLPITFCLSLFTGGELVCSAFQVHVSLALLHSVSCGSSLTHEQSLFMSLSNCLA